ncbi:unnamed protein product [Menidia menidia]|uniref:(Atlantic silverside) hypothetical protein n=1 Tax=Menidia menidia TaxID=238744 RepID=A0A8S4BDP2_9TELE|nr:unnamed protein product [Menidia menidia]CAG5942187.1 unnamed protein product [Menidia menidia]
MEDARKNKQVEKDVTPKKVVDQKPKVPEPTPAKLSPGPSHHIHPTSPTLSPFSSYSFSSSSPPSGNGKRPPAEASSRLRLPLSSSVSRPLPVLDTHPERCPHAFVSKSISSY